MLKKNALLLSLCAISALASGYKIPEQSLNSTALGAAYVANALGADAAYYNPANLVFGGQKSEVEADLTYIRLTGIDFAKGTYESTSKSESFFIPHLFYASKPYGNWRFGASITTPAGLSKRWDDTRGKAYAEEFTLQVIELNPVAAYKINDQWALAFGLRGIYTDGVVKNDLTPYGGRSQNLEGDSLDYGWNTAVTFKPNASTTLAATYRSNVDLSVEGDAQVSGVGSMSAAVEIPLPAVLSLALAQTFGDLTLELVVERIYWSKYKQLDFNYGNAAIEASSMGAPTPKEWKDSNTYRLGATYRLNSDWKIMGGFAIDKTPVPTNRMSFELPDSDSKIYSLGARYTISPEMEIGAAYLLSDKEKRSTDLAGALANGGTFSNAQAHLVTLGFTYRY